MTESATSRQAPPEYSVVCTKCAELTRGVPAKETEVKLEGDHKAYPLKLTLQITEQHSIFARMIPRRLTPLLLEHLQAFPAVALLGPRQVGKSTLAHALANGQHLIDQPAFSDSSGKAHLAIYLDLESPQDQAKLQDPELYLGDRLDRLVIIDEVHRAPGLFPALRGLIDKARRTALSDPTGTTQANGRYLLLGSASLDLLQQSSETLAGRISYLELPPIHALECPQIDRLWLRGGFPDSLLAASDRASMRWRQSFIRTYLERDIPMFGPRIAAETLRRFWTMLAHQQGSLLNTTELARNLGVDVKTAGGYLDLLVDLLLVRRLQPWHSNIGKRLVKSPRVYVRDSGLVHALLGLESSEQLLGHPVVGASWECFVIETLINCAPEGVTAYFYRTSAGAEIDLLLDLPDGQRWAIEVKRSLSPKVERGFHHACEDLQPTQRWVVYPGLERYRINEGLEAMPLLEAARAVAAI